MRTNAPSAWSIHPFLRIAPPFLIGLLMGSFRLADFAMIRACVMASLTLWLCWMMLKPVMRWRWKSLTGLSIYPLLVACGMACSLLHHPPTPTCSVQTKGSKQPWVVQLTEVNGPKYGRYGARATPFKDSICGDLLLYIDSTAVSGPPQPGDCYAIHADRRVIRNKGNPGEADIASLQASKGVFFRAFVKEGEILWLGRRSSASLEALFTGSRLWIESVLHRYLTDTASADLAATLLTGHRTAMDPELLRAYADTGVVHVIAISGLHLGLIHALLLWISTPMFRRIGRLKAAGLFVLPWLWIYSLFTGASASVMRSAVMFTGMGLAVALGRKQFFLNGLGSSAILLLAWRPDWIFDIGFQLSYAALLSIGMFQPALRQSINFSSPAARMIWDLVTVTLAAQVLTAPLVAWHFHRLPLLFLFSNLPVVPLSSMVLLLGIGICLFAWLPPVAHALGTMATQLIHLMNGQVRGIDAVPFGSLAELRPGLLQVVILYATILLLRYGSGTRWLVKAYACWVLVTGYRLLGIRHDLAIDRQRTLVVFQAGRRSLYGIVEGRNMLVLSGPFSEQDGLVRENCIRQAVERYQCLPPTVLGLVPGKTITWTAGGGRWVIHSGSGAIWVENRSQGMVAEFRNGDFREDAEHSIPVPGKNLLVADGSCSLWKIQRWKSTLEGVPLRFHSVPEQGAFIFDMHPPPRPAP